MKQLVPIFAWLLLLPLAGMDYLNEHWECLLVMFAALVLVPKGLGIVGFSIGKWYWLAAISFCAAYLLDGPGLGWSDGLALPYLLTSVWLTLREATELLGPGKAGIRSLVRVFAIGYWATGAFWAMCFLAGFQPIGFDPVIVSLTAAHFHVAGFVVAVAAWCLAGENDQLSTRFISVGVLAGMPLVALGISLSKLGFPTWIEMVSGVAFVLLAVVLAIKHIQLFSEQQYPLNARRLWLSGALCLLIGGTLAAIYALRFQYPWEFFNIPNMKIWHGSLNALGFGWLVLLGWERWYLQGNKSSI